MLFNVFERKTAALKGKAKGDTVVERAKWLAAQREKEGFMSQYISGETEGGPQILECHSPILNLLDQYPIIGRLEHDLIAGVLDTEFGAKKPALRVCTSARSISRSDFLRTILHGEFRFRSRRISVD
jgi:predicted ArsR family transcriptional regulator